MRERRVPDVINGSTRTLERVPLNRPYPSLVSRCRYWPISPPVCSSIHSSASCSIAPTPSSIDLGNGTIILHKCAVTDLWLLPGQPVQDATATSGSRASSDDLRQFSNRDDASNDNVDGPTLGEELHRGTASSQPVSVSSHCQLREEVVIHFATDGATDTRIQKGHMSRRFILEDATRAYTLVMEGPAEMLPVAGDAIAVRTSEMHNTREPASKGIIHSRWSLAMHACGSGRRRWTL